MVESVKHAIVLLQIAKNASCQSEAESADDNLAPVHGIELAVDKSEEVSEAGAVGGASLGAETDSRSSLSSPRRSPVSASPRISPAAHLRVVTTGAPSKAMKNSTIPAVSYSSSDDDEDDFFDAQDDVASKAGSDVVQIRAPSPVSLVSPMTPSEVDWDTLYEDDDGMEEDVDMKSHGSVITHLLSQVRELVEHFMLVAICLCQVTQDLNSSLLKS